jgi:uncharacterized protein YbjT (DUF2867 family)
MELLVVGGTGTVGSHVVRALLAKGCAVRVLTRSPERAAAVPAGAEAVLGDLQHPEGLGPAFHGVKAVFLLVSQAADETEQGIAAVKAARQAGVEKIVYMAVHNFEFALQVPHFARKVPIARAILESDMAFTLLEPNSFFQVDLGLQDAIVKHGVYPLPIGSVGLSRVDARDIADAAAAALTEPGHDGAVYPLVGPEVLTGESVAAAWSRHLGREVRYAGDDLEAWAAQARATMPERQVRELVTMWEHVQQHGMAATAEELELQAKVLGHPPRSFDAFAAETAAHWQAHAAAS